MKMKTLTNKKGFTLIELIVVMAVIGILVLLAAPRFLGYTKDANVSAMKADAKVLENVSLIYNIENEAWPNQTREAGVDLVLGTEDDVLTAGVVIDPTTYVLLDAELPVGTAVFPIDQYAINTQVKSLKGDFADYGIIVSGDLEGTVVHLAGVVDRNAVTHYATDIDNK